MALAIYLNDTIQGFIVQTIAYYMSVMKHFLLYNIPHLPSLILKPSFYSTLLFVLFLFSSLQKISSSVIPSSLVFLLRPYFYYLFSAFSGYLIWSLPPTNKSPNSGDFTPTYLLGLSGAHISVTWTKTLQNCNQFHTFYIPFFRNSP